MPVVEQSNNSKKKRIAWTISNILAQAVLKALIIALSIFYTKGKLKASVFFTASFVVSLILAGIFLYANSKRKESTDKVEQALEKLKKLEKPGDESNVETKKVKKSSNLFAIVVTTQLISAIGSVLAPFLYKKEIIKEIPYYCFLLISMLFGSVLQFTSVYIRLQNTDDTTELLDIVNSIDKVTFTEGVTI